MNTPTRDQQFETLLDYLRQNRGFDFTGYKRSSLIRRIEKRMQVLGIEEFDAYGDYLEVSAEEFSHLFNSILINVTGFFRDPIAWEFIVQDIVPRLLAAHEETESIRIWSAGCASGEEAYTLAMIFAEALGFEQFRERIKIYATDVDEEALAQARQANYSVREVSGVPAYLLEKYFEQAANRYIFHKDLRRAMIFGRHDILKDAPISRVDLLVCRNTLMYFNAEMQAQVLARFNFALNESGYLFLGKAEMLFTHANLFTPVELKRRIFSKVAKGTAREWLLLAGVPDPPSGITNSMNGMAKLREQSFDTGAVAQIVVELVGTLAMANERARNMFRLSARDIGRVLQDLEVSYRPLELRSRIEQAYAERRVVEVKEVFWSGISGSEQLYLDVQVVPLQDNSGSLIGVTITFADVTRYKRLQQQLEDSNRELETAYEELQSTNEELETMNEELQSTNEELQTINEELQTRSAELNNVNAFLTSILASLRGGVIVLDRDMQVKVWNSKSEDLWGLRSDEVQGKHLLNLDIGLPAEELKTPIRSCLSAKESYQEILLEAHNRRGRAIQCKIICTPLLNQNTDIIGAILMIEDMAGAEKSQGTPDRL